MGSGEKSFRGYGLRLIGMLVWVVLLVADRRMQA
jgi:hypothetical protein